MMKKNINFVIIFWGIFAICYSRQLDLKKDFSGYYGVWANKDNEVVQTKKYTLIFSRELGKIRAILRRNISESNLTFSEFVIGYNFNIKEKSYKKIESTESKKILLDSLFCLKGGKLELRLNSKKQLLEMVEKIEVCEPYQMLVAEEGKIGKSLQSWQLGTIEHKLDLNDFWLEIGTNKHLYIFIANPNQLYCRAARIRSNDKGSVFAQNIRLMFSAHNNETTIYMNENNHEITSSDLKIDNSLFKPNVCSFEKGGIYWSFISSKPDTIKLNGCGAVYTFPRPSLNDKNRVEWFKYRDY